MKCIIAGGRTFDDYDLLERKLDKILCKAKNLEICHGNAKGADKLGEWWGFKNKKAVVKIFHPDWQKHGKAAGVIRNKEMVEYADCLIAFWDGHSKGTENIINLAKEAGLQVRVIKYQGSGFASYYKNTEQYPCGTKKSPRKKSKKIKIKKRSNPDG